MTTNEVVGATLGILTILGIIMKFFQYLFRKIGLINLNKDQIDEIKKQIKLVRETDIKEIEEDIKNVDSKVDIISKAVSDSEKILVDTINKNHSEVLKMLIEMGKEKKK